MEDIELVIKIPDKLYETIISDEYGIHQGRIYDIIRHGTPLPKIRAEIESCREDEEPHLCDYRYHRNEGLDMALEIIDKYKESEEEE